MSVPVLPDTQTVPVEETTVVQVDLPAPTPPPAPPLPAPEPAPVPPVKPEPELPPEVIPDPPPAPEPELPPVAPPEPEPPAEPAPDVAPEPELVLPSEPPIVDEPINVIPVQEQPQIVLPTVTLPNGVVLEEEVAVALALFDNPAELMSELFTNPGAVLTAFSNIGADMSPQVRDKAEKTIVAAVIVGQIATQSAVVAATGAAAYRRKP